MDQSTNEILALAISGSALLLNFANFLYTRSVSKRSKDNDLNRAEFDGLVRMPAETQLAEIEDCISSIKAASLGPPDNVRRSQIEKIVKDRLHPIHYKLANVLRRADHSSTIRGSNWEEEGEDKFEGVFDAADKVCSSLADAERMNDGQDELIEQLQSFCRHFRDRFSQEIRRH